MSPREVRTTRNIAMHCQILPLETFGMQIPSSIAQEVACLTEKVCSRQTYLGPRNFPFRLRERVMGGSG